MTDTAIKIYTDGSCSPNPGPGGWAAILIFEDGNKIVEISGGEAQTTNNRMELSAALKALEKLNDNVQVEVFTDSRYVQRGTGWINRWLQSNWLTSEGESVKNQDLWQPLAFQLRRLQVEWNWVKGHGTNKWNRRADELAAIARQGHENRPRAVSGIDLYLGVTWRKTISAGTWVTILSYGTQQKILYGAESDTTANRLYLIAAISGIKALKRILPVNIHTRSGYLRDGMNAWLEGWGKNDWKNREGAEISNKYQWVELHKLKKKFHINIISYSSSLPPCFAQEAKELAREFQHLQ